MSLSDLCSGYINTSKLKDDSDKNIIEFCESGWGLGFGASPDIPPLMPVQKFIFKCYYNIPLDITDRRIIVRDRFNEKERYRFTEQDYLNFLWNEGRINIKEVTGDPKDTRMNLCLVVGRRGLKTSSISIVSGFEVYKLIKKYSPQEYYGIMPDDEIRISCIATNQEQASELFRRITGHLERSEYFKRFRNKPTLGYMLLGSQRDIDQYGPGQRPSIRIVAAPCSGRGLRGHNNIVVILDEMAYFFESETSQDKSDKSVYDAVTPSVAKFNTPEGNPDGRVICISSPGPRSGKFYEIYQRSMEADCNDILMIRAPSWEVDPTLSSRYLRSKYLDNPVTYMSEFGAEFSDRVSAWIDNDQILRVNVIPGLKEKTKSYERAPHFMGTDFGSKNDGSAVAICHIVKKDVGGLIRDMIELDCVEVRYAKDEDKDFFHPEEIAEWYSTFMEKFFVVSGMMDQFYGLSILPALEKKGHKQFKMETMTREFNSRIYQNLMSKMLDVSLRIPEGTERVVDGRPTTDLPLVHELLKLRATIHSKYIISVEAPEIKGVHDDMSDAYARAVWLATEYLNTGGSTRSITPQQSAASRMNYKKYYNRQKISAIHTNRPSSSIQADIYRNTHLSKMGLTRMGLGRRGF